METNPGPIDGSILYDQDKHVSAAVWEGQERGALRCHEHTSKLGEWKLNPRQIELVEKAGFGYLRKIPAISLDNPLISALVERWRRETNTFHFIVGEMTVTLQDVALLLGLAIDGKPVIGITHTTCTKVCETLLGRAPDSNYASGGMVKLSWLKEFFSHCPEDALPEQIEQCTRAYLLYLVGSTIFSTTTGNKVPVMYLPLFENFEDAGNYAWGAAALAFLYRALGNACVKSQSTICGCLTLLQCWSYFHLNIGRPKLNRDPIHDHFPFVLRWKGKQSGPTTNRDVVFYRKALDSLQPTDVEWLPYQQMDNAVIPEIIRRTLLLGRSKTMLICFDKAERHLPDRCFRQYGMAQPIPEDVVRWVRKSRGVDGGVDLSGKMESELNEWMDRNLHVVDVGDGADECEYMQWYLKITRKVVGRPISLSSEFQRTISGLREIAYLADSFTTKGLDGQQFESITRIRFIAQDCLRDQSESPVSPQPAPQIEIGKRTRGKERVRRKGAMKRRRKDDVLEYYEASEDDQSQFYDAVIEVDPLHLRQGEEEMDELQLHQEDDDVDPRQMCLTPREGNAMEMNVVMNKVDDSHLIDATNESNNNYLPCNSNNEIKDPQICDVRTKEVVNFEQCDPTNAEATANESCDALYKVNNDQLLQEPIINGSNESQIPEAGNEENSYTKEARDTQLPDAIEEASKSQVIAGTDEGNDSQLHGPLIEEVRGLELPDATKEGKGSRTPDSLGEGRNVLPPDPTEDEKDTLVRLSDTTKDSNKSTVLDATKHGSGARISEAVEEGKELTWQGDGLHLPDGDVGNEANNSMLPRSADDDDSSVAKEVNKDVTGSTLEIVGDVTKQADKRVRVK
ncbi:Aminotransferase-like plant mobile domain family protein [Euphorbia peplus]|nr:Aminotransferase-like plant mobile domain family protein [Euphorbia peplus]